MTFVNHIFKLWDKVRPEILVDDVNNRHKSASVKQLNTDNRYYHQLTFAPHINRLCRDCYYQLRQQHVIFRSLTSTATPTLVHAFVTSRLDYCSILYVGLPASGLPRAGYPQ